MYSSLNSMLTRGDHLVVIICYIECSSVELEWELQILATSVWSVLWRNFYLCYVTIRCIFKEIRHGLEFCFMCLCVCVVVNSLCHTFVFWPLIPHSPEVTMWSRSAPSIIICVMLLWAHSAELSGILWRSSNNRWTLMPFLPGLAQLHGLMLGFGILWDSKSTHLILHKKRTSFIHHNHCHVIAWVMPNSHKVCWA